MKHLANSVLNCWVRCVCTNQMCNKVSLCKATDLQLSLHKAFFHPTTSSYQGPYILACDCTCPVQPLQLPHLFLYYWSIALGNPKNTTTLSPPAPPPPPYKQGLNLLWGPLRGLKLNMGGGGGEHFRSIRIIMCKSPSGPSSVMTFVYALKLGGGGGS